MENADGIKLDIGDDENGKLERHKGKGGSDERSQSGRGNACEQAWRSGKTIVALGFNFLR